MDIEKLYTKKQHENGADLRLKDQYGKDTTMYLTLVGLDSSTWRNAYADGQRLAISDDKITTDEIMAECFSKTILGWKGFTSSGKKLKFTVKKARELLLAAPYLITQIDNFISNRKNFTKS